MSSSGLATAPIVSVKSQEAEKIQRLQKTLSASRLQTWLRCRLQFYFRYVVGMTKPPTASLHSGKVMHAVLQQWNLSRWRREPFDTERFKTFFEKDWKEGQADTVIRWAEGEEDEQRSSSWTALQCYFMATPIKQDERPEAVEVSVETELEGLPSLVGIIDLVRAGSRIVDFKTTSRTPEIEQLGHQHEIQTSCYAVLYRDCTGKRERDIELHHLVKLKTPKLIVTSLGPMIEHQRTRLFRLMESYVEGLERRDFVPSPCMNCSFCEFLNECRHWNGADQH